MGETHLKQELSDTCTLIERYNFFSIKLHDYASFDEFVNDLEHKSNLCNFLERGNIIRDIVILKVLELNKEGLLPLLNDTLTFNEIINLCRDSVPLKYVGKADPFIDDFYGKTEIDEGGSEIKHDIVDRTEYVPTKERKREKKTHVKQRKRDSMNGKGSMVSQARDSPSQIKQEQDMEETNITGNFHCTNCNKPFETLPILERHYLVKHNAHKCGQCAKQFKTRQHLSVHKYAVHRPRSRIECPTCHNYYKEGKNYNKHMQRHRYNELRAENVDPGVLLDLEKRLKGTPVLCTICGKSFAAKRNLNDHMNAHAGVRRYACKLCPKKFFSRANVDCHQQTHAETPTHKCRFCGKMIKHKSYLREHEGQHLGIRKYPCSYCDKTFACHSTRKYHERLHTGDLPFQCKHCEKAFAQPNGLKSHMKSHV